MSDALARTNPDLPMYSPEGLLTAAVIENPKVYQEIRWVDADMFEWPVVRDVYVAVEWVLDKHPDLDSFELIARAKNVLIEYKRGPALDLLVRMMGANTAVGSEAPRYARALWEQYQQVMLQSACLRMQQIAQSDQLDLDRKLELVEETYTEAMTVSHSEAGWRPIEGLEPIAEFMAKGDDDHDWIIPGMLEREERFMCVAPEKAGKSVLTRQFVMMLANGYHPFKPNERIEAMTTLMIDLENPGPIARRDFRRQVSSMENLWSAENGRAFIWHKPAGIHLGDKADRVALRDVVNRVEPDFLAVSPIYKAYDGLEESWEKQAHGVQKPFDKIREEFHCALWFEHHAPWGEKGMREIRAIGSSRWARWLDYTVSLIPHGKPPYKALEWRSVRRDERKMSPYGIRRGEPGEPSWVPVWPDDAEGYGFDLARHEAEM